jgi:hypothetical protein
MRAEILDDGYEREIKKELRGEVRHTLRNWGRLLAW